MARCTPLRCCWPSLAAPLCPGLACCGGERPLNTSARRVQMCAIGMCRENALAWLKRRPDFAATYLTDLGTLRGDAASRRCLSLLPVADIHVTVELD